MGKKKIIITSIALVTVALLSAVTFAYIRRQMTGTITAPTANLVLKVNDANAESNQTFDISLNRSEEEPFILPDDKGSFDINIDASGSTRDVVVTFSIARTNIPEGLRFYLDEELTQPLSRATYELEKADSMVKDLKVYWFWDGTVNSANDMLFLNKSMNATINVSIKNGKTLYEMLSLSDFTLDTNVDFEVAPSSTNGEGLMLMDSTRHDEYPIYYYRGNITNNNVIFANYCWLIVRTTETGGVKLLYNGEVNANGGCNDYRDTAFDDFGGFISSETHPFNEKVDSPIYVGYMYNDLSTYFERVDDTWTLDILGYKEHLADESIDQLTGRHVQNLKDSNIKMIIDDWYEQNILNTNFKISLEDAVWCNDRSVISENYSIENYNVNDSFEFAGYTRLRTAHMSTVQQVIPSLTCARTIDRFTVSNSNGNSDLTYPIGLLTADEAIMAGSIAFNSSNSKRNYLSIAGMFFYTMTPSSFSMNESSVSHVATLGYINWFNDASNTSYVRPMISLRYDVYVTSGNGTFESPYEIGK